MKKVLLLTAMFFASSPISWASNAGPLVPSYLTYRSDGIAYVWFNGTRSGTVPSCTTQYVAGTWFRMAIDTTSNSGRALLAGLMASHTSGEAMWITGSGSCNIASDTESLLEAEANG